MPHISISVLHIRPVLYTIVHHANGTKYSPELGADVVDLPWSW